MNVRLATLALFTLAAFCFAAPALADDPSKAEVEAYLGGITKTHGRLNESGKSFGSLLGPALNGGDKELVAIYRAYRGMAQLVWKIQLETKEFEVPDHELAREVKAANDRFLIYQREVVLSKLPGLLEILDDATLEAEAKKEKILAAITRDNEREVQLGTQLREAMAKLRQVAQ